MNVVKIKQLILYFCMCLLLAAGWQMVLPPPAHADTAVSLQVSAGFGGEYKDAELIPVQITVTNNGADIEGELVFTADNDDSGNAVYYQPISIGKGSTKKVTMMIPGNVQRTSSIRLMQGKTEVAKGIVAGSRFNSDTVFIGILASEPDTANFLATLPKSSFSRPVRPVWLQAEDLPNAVLPLQMMDVLVLNNFSTGSLNVEQVQAIRDWTNQGGRLVLAGGAYWGKTSSELRELSPVSVDGTAAVQSLASLVSGKHNKPISLEHPFTVSTGTVKAGQVLYQEGNIPVFAMAEANKGKVLYAAYDLAEEPMASWPGNSELWAELLAKAFGQTSNNSKFDPFGNSYQLIDASENIPGLTAPNLTFLSLFFAGYILLAGPVLFLLFRGKKRRSYLWGVGPAAAIAMCLGVFLYGIAQRGTDVIVHNVSYLELTGTGQASAATATAIFVPSGGDYEMRAKNGEMILPNRWYYRGLTSGTTRINVTPQQSSIHFDDASYWSIKSGFTKKMIKDAGRIESDLMYRDGKLVGTVTNKTSYPLRDVKLLNGRNVQDLGTLAVGASADVEMNFEVMAQPNRDSYQARKGLLPSELQQQKQFDATREFSMLGMLDEDRGTNFWRTPVKVIGWTEQPIADVEIIGKRTKEANLALVSSSLDVKPSADGYVFYPAGTFTPEKTSSPPRTYENGSGYYMGAGEITFEFDIQKEQQPINVTKVYLYTWSEDRTSFDKKVYNWKTNAFDPFSDAFENNALSGDKLKQYVSSAGKLRLMLSHKYEEDRHIGLPEISVEGWVAK
ncbi:hypothetical protein ACI7RC_00750 [Brevibacillus sp. B_LB10_24]|uniref:DUF7408 domain-containing protein n=1 Tax=Brevibacillus sp. B_LB10_24 TaxID=3380645 RepID=UPI0038BCB0F4